MKRHARVMAGLLALVALTFSLAETVTASMCLPGRSLDGIVVDSEEGPVADDCMRMLHGREDGERGDDGGHHCPFGPVAGASSCTAPASVPSHAVADLALSPENAAAIASDVPRRDVLFTATFFHPPKS